MQARRRRARLEPRQSYARDREGAKRGKRRALPMRRRNAVAEGEDMVRAHVVVSGRVQGVWFRGRTRDKAEALGVTGWVRNRRDGAVEAVFEGSRPAVERMVAWCYQGPPLAVVQHVDLRWGDFTGEFAGFSVTY